MKALRKLKLMYFYTYISEKIRKGFQVWPSYVYYWFNITCVNSVWGFFRASGFIDFFSKVSNFVRADVFACFLAIINFTFSSSGSSGYPIYCNERCIDIIEIGRRTIIYRNSFIQRDNPKLIDLKKMLQRCINNQKTCLKEFNKMDWGLWSFNQSSSLAYFIIAPIADRLVPKLLYSKYSFHYLGQIKRIVK